MLFILFFILFTTFSSVYAQQNFKRMMLFIDEDAEGPDKKAALSQSFGINLHQHASPAIVPYSVLDGFLQRALKQRNVTNKNIFGLIDFNPTNWSISYCTNSPFFLFVPKKAMLKRFNSKTNNIENVEKESLQWMIDPEEVTIKIPSTDNPENLVTVTIKIPSIKIANLEPYTPNPSSTDPLQDLFIWMQTKKTSKPTVEISQLERLFYNENDIKNDTALLNQVTSVVDIDEKVSLIKSLSTPWNFFVHGHGGYEEGWYIALVVALTVPKLNGLLTLLNRMNIYFVALSGCYSGGKNLDYIQFKKDFDEEKIGRNLNYMLAVISSTDAPTNTYISLGSYGNFNYPNISAGFNIEGFFMELENQSNENWLTDALLSVARDNQEEAVENIPQVLIPHIGWVQAFTPVKQSFGYRLKRSKTSPAQAPMSWVNPMAGKELKKNEWDKAVEQAKKDEINEIEKLLKKPSITEMGKVLLNERKALLKNPNYQPSPQPASSVQIIGNFILKKHLHEIGNKPIEIKQKKAVLLYPEIVTIPLEITPTNGEFPIILSMHHGNAAHVIDNITLTSGGLLQFIKNAFFTLKGRRSKKTFLINTLTGKNDLANLATSANPQITLHQALIHSWTDEYDQAHLHFYFKLGEKHWMLETLWGFAQIPESEFNNALATLNPEIPTLRIKLETALLEAPTWKLTQERTKPEQLTEPTNYINVKAKYPKIPKQLSTKQKGELEELKKQIQILKACYKVLNTWIDATSTIASIASNENLSQELLNQKLRELGLQKLREQKLLELGKNFSSLSPELKLNFINTILHELAQKKLHELGTNFSALSLEFKLNFINTMLKKFDRNTLRIIFEELMKIINQNNFQLVTLSAALYDHLLNFSGTNQEIEIQNKWTETHGAAIQQWFNKSHTYHKEYIQAKTTRKQKKLKAAEELSAKREKQINQALADAKIRKEEAAADKLKSEESKKNKKTLDYLESLRSELIRHETVLKTSLPQPFIPTAKDLATGNLLSLEDMYSKIIKNLLRVAQGQRSQKDAIDKLALPLANNLNIIVEKKATPMQETMKNLITSLDTDNAIGRQYPELAEPFQAIINPLISKLKKLKGSLSALQQKLANLKAKLNSLKNKLRDTSV